MKSGPLIAIIAVVLIALGAYAYFSRTMAPEPVALDTEVMGAGEDTEITEDSDLHRVTYTDAGFSPETITIKLGDTVTFVNEGDGRMWVGADEHPTHTEYAGTSRSEHCPDSSGTAFDQCEAGESFTFTFTKAGTWGYHNHSLASHAGTVIVTE